MDAERTAGVFKVNGNCLKVFKDNQRAYKAFHFL